jgi:hypothetical protein
LPTASQIDRIVAALERGNDRSVAATIGGVSRQTFYRWLAEGRDAIERADAGEELAGERERILADFAQRCDETEAAHESSLLAKATSACEPWTDAQGVARPGNGALLLDILGRRYPQRWAPQIRMRVDAEVDAILIALGKVLPREYYLLALEAIAHITDEGEANPRPLASREPGAQPA